MLNQLGLSFFECAPLVVSRETNIGVLLILFNIRYQTFKKIYKIILANFKII